MGLRFDWYHKVAESFIAVLAAELLDHIALQTAGLSQAKIEQRDQDYRDLAHQMLSAFYRASVTLSHEPTAVAIPLTQQHYSATGESRHKVPYSYTYTIKIKDTLLGLGWIALAEESQVGRSSRFAAAGGLALKFSQIGLIWMPSELTPAAKLVVLRDYKPLEAGQTKSKRRKRPKVDLSVPESDDVVSYRQTLYRYNQFIGQHCISLDVDDDNLTELLEDLFNNNDEKDSKDQFIDLSRTQLTRIFSRGSMTKGGRFYRGWWQSLPSKHRPLIKIDGYKTDEVDYSAVGVRIIYGKLGIDYPLDKDPYDIGLDNWRGPDDPRRKIIKKYINALINDEEGNFSLDKEKLSLLGVSKKTLKNLLIKEHKPILDSFSTGIGLDAQFTDSVVAEAVIVDMMKDGIVVLPIHDSFIVRAGYRQHLEQVMNAAFRDIAHASVATEATGIKTNNHFNMSMAEVDELAKTENQAVSIPDLSFNSLLKNHNSVMNKYLSSWESWRRG
ncbi:hypothetical protein OAD24_14975 [Pseudomonadales bacterium]|nr:hypothetical protein [Pseudomonadales bacterium]